jgi:putative molybdopterin biosynthesis protein
MKKRDIYLEDLPLDEAWRRIIAALEDADLWQPFDAEIVPLTQAHGRITAAPVWAILSSPHYHASAMDGYAVRSLDTQGASETHPITLNVVEQNPHPASPLQGGGGEPEVRKEGVATPVNTGHALPDWADAVIMVEHVLPTDSPDQIIIQSSVAPWQHVRPMGEDMVASELVLPANHKLRPVDLGALAGSGHATVAVRRRPRIAVIPTGSELVSIEGLGDSRGEGTLAPPAGQIIEYNSLVIAAQIEAWGGIATRWPIVKDTAESIRLALIEAAADHDMVLINAGSSAGTEDYSAQVIGDLGEVLVHGVAVRPGHPVIFGILDFRMRNLDLNGKGDRSESQSKISNLNSKIPVFGIPGYPVSAALTGEIFIEPILSKWLGQPPNTPQTIEATLSRKLTSPPGDDDYVRVTVGKVGERTIATPIARGAGVITSLVRADGIVRIPRFSEGVDAGAAVTVHLYRPPAEIERTRVHIGSHDMTLDLLSQFLAERHPGLRLASANVGSLGGLVALKRGEAHFAGAHLLDPDTGDYNWKYIDQYLPDRPIRLITLVEREQGLIVAQGNPLGLTGLDDLARQDIRFVNRQRGAGTRLLLEYELGKRGIAFDQVQGFEREEYTHLAVAAAVASGTASCGLGIRAAAKALGLDFIAVGWERYDLVMPIEYIDTVGALADAKQSAGPSPLQPIIDLLQDAPFRAAVAALEGYRIELMGQIAERRG